jgi:hypothetical protein
MSLQGHPCPFSFPYPEDYPSSDDYYPGTEDREDYPSRGHGNDRNLESHPDPYQEEKEHAVEEELGEVGEEEGEEDDELEKLEKNGRETEKEGGEKCGCCGRDLEGGYEDEEEEEYENWGRDERGLLPDPW